MNRWWKCYWRSWIILMPMGLLLWLFGGHFIHFAVVILFMIYVEVSEINEKLGK